MKLSSFPFNSLPGHLTMSSCSLEPIKVLYGGVISKGLHANAVYVYITCTMECMTIGYLLMLKMAI